MYSIITTAQRYSKLIEKNSNIRLLNGDLEIWILSTDLKNADAVKCHCNTFPKATTNSSLEDSDGTVLIMHENSPPNLQPSHAEWVGVIAEGVTDFSVIFSTLCDQ